MRNALDRYHSLLKGLLLASLLGAGVLGFPQPSFGFLLDLESMSHGQIASNLQGIVITTVNTGGGPDLGVIFDTRQTGTLDPDLEGPPQHLLVLRQRADQSGSWQYAYC